MFGTTIFWGVIPSQTKSKKGIVRIKECLKCARGKRNLKKYARGDIYNSTHVDKFKIACAIFSCCENLICTCQEFSDFSSFFLRFSHICSCMCEKMSLMLPMHKRIKYIRKSLSIFHFSKT